MKTRIFTFVISLLAITGIFAQKSKGLSRQQSENLATSIVSEWKKANTPKYQQWKQNQAVEANGLKMKFMYKIFGEAPADGRSLWISLHGGGGVPSAENDQQWDNQIRLYRPSEGLYVAPRAPWDAWNMWCQAPIDPLYEELIRLAVTTFNVNPNKVYLIGYSAGGDGVWRMAPRMADHWAASSMMAGHPGDVSLVNLRNLPFMIWCGGKDYAYNRNVLDAARGVQMDSLQQQDPQGYIHETHILADKGHWMDLEDAAAIPWLQKYTRNPYPSKIVWRQEEVLRPHFYWLSAPQNELARGKKVVVSVKNNKITLHRCDYSNLTIYLNDKLVNLDKPVTLMYKGKCIFNSKLPRLESNLQQTFSSRLDPSYIFPSKINVKVKH